MASSVVSNFMKQQGFADEPESLCNMHFSGLYFQPRIVGPLVVVAILLHSSLLFLALAAVLWWNVLFPEWNPFEVFYNHVIAVPRGKSTLAPAPAPRRFAQGMASTFMVVAALALQAGWVVTAWVVEALLVIAFMALLFGKFCLGAYIFHLLRGQRAFANATLPWARGRV
jgi:Domain of unknown function (DUF4395)